MFAFAEVDGEPGRVERPTPGSTDDLDSVVRRRIAQADTLEESATCLLFLLSGGYAVWEDGSLYYARALVETLGRLKIIIHTREHGPAHFHVRAPGLNASFSIDACELLEGEISARDRRLVEYWHTAARPRLVQVWNATRPSDCPVGPIAP